MASCISIYNLQISSDDMCRMFFYDGSLFGGVGVGEEGTACTLFLTLAENHCAWNDTFFFFLFWQKIVCNIHILLLCCMTENCVQHTHSSSLLYDRKLCVMLFTVLNQFYFVVGFDVCCSQGIFSFRVTRGRWRLGTLGWQRTISSALEILWSHLPLCLMKVGDENKCVAKCVGHCVFACLYMCVCVCEHTQAEKRVLPVCGSLCVFAFLQYVCVWEGTQAKEKVFSQACVSLCVCIPTYVCVWEGTQAKEKVFSQACVSPCLHSYIMCVIEGTHKQLVANLKNESEWCQNIQQCCCKC